MESGFIIHFYVLSNKQTTFIPYEELIIASLKPMIIQEQKDASLVAMRAPVLLWPGQTGDKAANWDQGLQWPPDLW